MSGVAGERGHGRDGRDGADLRPRVTARVLAFLRDGRSVLALGGPGTGKSHLAAAIRGEWPGLRIVDGERADGPAAASAGGPALVTAGVDRYEERRAGLGGAAFVPLVNLAPKAVVLDLDLGPPAWEATAGHPALLAGWRAGGATGARRAASALRPDWEDLLAARPEEAELLRRLREMVGASPARRYLALHEDHGRGLKAPLDWLCAAGLVSRFIDGDSPGALPVPAT